MKFLKIKKILPASLIVLCLCGQGSVLANASIVNNYSVCYAAEFDYRAVFDSTYYAQRYPDVAAIYGTEPEALYSHFVNAGMAEVRQPSAAFNVQIYMSNYEDLQSIFGSDIAAYYKHYISSGKNESRVGDHLLPGKKLKDFSELSAVSVPAKDNQIQEKTYDFITPSSTLVVVNHSHGIDTKYVPSVASVGNGQLMREDVAPIVLKMMSDARKQGVGISVVSGYRSASRQTMLYNRKVNYYKSLGCNDEDARRKAATVVNPPGYSEHQTGLCMDITDTSYRGLTTSQERTKGYQWILAHCAEYGFILRYPVGKENVTEVIYEPWHFRYVGKEAAIEIMQRGITLEEYAAERGLK